MERFKERLSKRNFIKMFSIAALGVGLSACESLTRAPTSKLAPTPQKKDTPATPKLVSEVIPSVEPETAPSGKLLCFTQPEVGYGHEYLEKNPTATEESELWLANSDGTEPKPIATGGLLSLPSWSPQGDRFTFQQYRRGEQGDYGALMICDNNGKLLRWTGINQGLIPAKLSWSPDENFIIYSSRFFNPRSTVLGVSDFEEWRGAWIGGIYQYNLKTGKLVQIIQSSKGELDHDPAVSPDGSKLIFVNHQWGTEFSIVLAPLKPHTEEDRWPGTNPEICEIDRGYSTVLNASIRFQWTPDGKRVVYMLEKSAGNSLYITDVSVSPIPPPLEIKLDCPSYIKNDPFTYLDPQLGNQLVERNYHSLDSMDLSPDGRQIVVGCPSLLFITDIEGKERKTIKLPKSISGNPDNVRWLSGANQIAFVHNSKYYYISSEGSGLKEVSLNFKPFIEGKQLPLGFLISTGD